MPAPVIVLPVSVPVELPPLPLNETAMTPTFIGPESVLPVTVALPWSRKTPLKRLPTIVLPLMVENMSTPVPNDCVTGSGPHEGLLHWLPVMVLPLTVAAAEREI